MIDKFWCVFMPHCVVPCTIYLTVAAPNRTDYW